MFKELNPLLHSELRLAVMSMLLSVEEAEFTYLKQETKAKRSSLCSRGLSSLNMILCLLV